MQEDTVHIRAAVLVECAHTVPACASMPRSEARSTGSTRMPAFDDYLRENQARHLEEVSQALRFPSVSALPQHRDDMRATAEWVADFMRRIGIPEVELIEGGGHPLVYGRWIVEPGAPVAMVY